MSTGRMLEDTIAQLDSAEERLAKAIGERDQLAEILREILAAKESGNSWAAERQEARDILASLK